MLLSLRLNFLESLYVWGVSVKKVYERCERSNGAYADLGEIGDCGASWSPGACGSCDGLRLKMNEEGRASSLGMRERGWGPGMRTHSSSKRTPRAPALSTTAMDRGWEWGDMEGCGTTDALPVNSTQGEHHAGVAVPGPRCAANCHHVFLPTPSTNHEPPLERCLSWPPKWRRCHNNRYCASPRRSALILVFAQVTKLAPQALRRYERPFGHPIARLKRALARIGNR